MNNMDTTLKVTIAKAIAWPIVAIIALLVFRTEIAAALPNVQKLTLGSLSIEKVSPLGQRASTEVVEALEGLTESSIFTLISRSLPITCFAPPVLVIPNRDQHEQLIKKGLFVEIQASDLLAKCSYLKNPNFGIRRTDLGEKARSFQLSILEELSVR
jgi:hypothetical protein